MLSIIIQHEENDILDKQYQAIHSKKFRNTKENADLDNEVGKEYLERAKEGGIEQNKNNKLAAKNLIDSAEKYAKANVIIDNKENIAYSNPNRNNKKERVLHTHSFQVLSQAPSNSEILLQEDASFLDKYANPEEEVYSTHTALSYGDAQPTLAELEKINNITNKLKENLEERENKINDRYNTNKLADTVIQFISFGNSF